MVTEVLTLGGERTMLYIWCIIEYYWIWCIIEHIMQYTYDVSFDNTSYVIHFKYIIHFKPI